MSERKYTSPSRLLTPFAKVTVYRTVQALGEIPEDDMIARVYRVIENYNTVMERYGDRSEEALELEPVPEPDHIRKFYKLHRYMSLSIPCWGISRLERNTHAQKVTRAELLKSGVHI